MNSDNSYNDPLPALLSAMLDGAMTSADEARLAALLSDNPQAQQSYLDFCWTHALLRQELCGYGKVTESKGTEDQRPHPASFIVPAPSFLHSRAIGVPFAYALAILIFAAAVVVTSAWKVSVNQPLLTDQTQPSSSQHAPGEVSHVEFRVTKAINCRWADGNAAAGDAAKGNFRFLSGTLEIVHGCGATVVLEGPCNYQITDNNAGCLFLGKLTATVPETFMPIRPKADGGTMGAALSGDASPRNKNLPSTTARAPFIVYTRGGTLASRGGVFRVQVDETDVIAATLRGTVTMRPAPGGMFRQMPVVAGESPVGAQADGKEGG